MLKSMKAVEFTFMWMSSKRTPQIDSGILPQILCIQKRIFSFKALKVRPQREVRFCKKIDDDFLEMLNRKKPKDIEEVENLWYDGDTRTENMNTMMIRGIMP